MINEILRRTDADACLITGDVNRFYLTGFESSFGLVALAGGEAVYVTDSRYIEAAQAKVKHIRTVEAADPYEPVYELFGAHGVKTVAVETDYVTVDDYRALEKRLAAKGFEVVETKSLSAALRDLRSIKSAEQIEKMTKAQRIAEQAFETLKKEIVPGKTERELQLRLDFLMLSMGAEALSFDTITASGENGSKPHAVPSSRKVKDGDFITFDFGAVYDGYHSDMTRTVCLGSCSDDMKKVYDIVYNAQQAVIDGIKPGMTCRDADALARDIIEKEGYGDFYRHGTGHSVGLEIHEPPFVSPKSSDVLKPGQVVTDEPGIYLPGKFGVRIEDMLLITENGCVDITECERKLVIL